MKKTLAALIAILLPVTGLPASGFAGASGDDAPSRLVDRFSQQEAALWHLPGANDDGGCALAEPADEAKVSACKARLGKIAEAYVAKPFSAFPGTGWTPEEAAYLGNHPGLKGTDGFKALEALFTGSELSGCGTPELKSSLLTGLRHLIKLDMQRYLESGEGTETLVAVKDGFAAGVETCESAIAKVLENHERLQNAVINKFTPLENALLLDQHRTPKEKEAFQEAAWKAAFGSAADRLTYYRNYRKMARDYAGTRAGELPPINGKEDAVLKMLSDTDRQFLDAAVGEETKKAVRAKIAAADEAAKNGDKKPAIELAKRIRAMVTASFTHYAADGKPIDAKEQLRKIDRMADIALNPNQSLEDSIRLIQKEFDGSRIEDAVVLTPEEDSASGKVDLVVDNSNLNPNGSQEPPKPNAVEVAPDKEVGDAAGAAAAAAKTKARKFKRALLGAAYGAVALGFCGMIFGGPIGALVAAAAGAAIMGGVVHMVNNPIK